MQYCLIVCVVVSGSFSQLRKCTCLLGPGTNTNYENNIIELGHCKLYCTYSRSSCKRPPREFEKVVVIRAGRLQEYALKSDPMVKQ